MLSFLLKTRFTKLFITLVFLGAGLSGHIAVQADNHNDDVIKIVGSSTVFPFSVAVAEEFGISTDFPTPIVESTGTGGGFKLFCGGIGKDFPDIANASRAIKPSELSKCTENGITPVGVMFGYDGIVLANKKGGFHYNLTTKQLFLALAAKVPNKDSTALIDNPYKKWSDIDASLPNVAIYIYGPPPTSGTRDAFLELVMEPGAKSFDLIKKMDKKTMKAVAHSIREDGVFVDAGENDNLIVQKLLHNDDALGIFGFGFLDQNSDRMQGSLIDNVAPTFENIASGDYSVARSLYFYVKKEHLSSKPALYEFVEHFLSEDAAGLEGYLLDRGLIPLDEELLNSTLDTALDALK